MNKPTLGIQLFTLMRHIQTAEDFDDTLAKLESLGVRTVQISGINEDIPAQRQKDILDKHKMKVCITHKDFAKMCNNLQELVAEHRIIDCEAIGLGCVPSSVLPDYRLAAEFAAQAQAVARNMNAMGMSFHYHNHAFDFNKLEGTDTNMIELLLARPEVNFVPDVAWIHFAGVDPVEMLYRMKGRVKVVHFKDYTVDENGELHFVSLGKGRVDLRACYNAVKELAIPYIVYEQDSGWVNDDAFLATQQSWDYMQSLQ